jgi:hypothetical protein
MSVSATPPAWAEGVLRLCVRSGDFDSVSGDLLEEYRDSIVPARGQRRADFWYVKQVFGFVWRGTRLWAIAFSAAFLGRMAFDEFVRTDDFYTRSMITTVVASGLLLSAGFFAAWRSGSFVAGALAGAATAAIAAVISIAGVAILLSVWHDPQTLAAIRASGGLNEAMTLPVMAVVPAVALGTMGGVLGAIVRKLGAAAVR